VLKRKNLITQLGFVGPVGSSTVIGNAELPLGIPGYVVSVVVGCL
jgi:hypothetical protein